MPCSSVYCKQLRNLKSRTKFTINLETYVQHGVSKWQVNRAVYVYCDHSLHSPPLMYAENLTATKFVPNLVSITKRNKAKRKIVVKFIRKFRVFFASARKKNVSCIRLEFWEFTFSLDLLNFPRRFCGCGVFPIIIISNSRCSRLSSRASNSSFCLRSFCSVSICWICFCFSSSSLQRNS